MNAGRSPYTAPFEWTRGKLNASSFRAFCKFAGKVFDCYPPSAVLKEVAALIEAAGDSPDKGKLVEQFRDALAFVSHERACDALDVPELRAQRVEGTRAEGKWPEPDPALIESVRREHADHTLARWRAISPRHAVAPRHVLPALFSPGEVVCFGPRKNVHWVRRMDDMLLEELAPGAQFVVPNPVRAGYTVPPGKRSPKCDGNFPARRFLIVEFDRERIDPARKLAVSELLDLQAGLHADLAERWGALALLVYSGNESLHGWYRCSGVDEEKVIGFLRDACRLGADHAFRNLRRGLRLRPFRPCFARGPGSNWSRTLTSKP